MAKMHVKTGDKVQIISGKDKGKQGKVLEVSPKEGKIIIEGCKAMLVCPKCGKPTRVHHKVNADGKKERQCKCGETF